MCDEKVKEWLRLAMENEDIVNYAVNIHGEGNKDDGYLSKFLLVTATGKTKNGKEKFLNLALKLCPTSNILRKQIPIRKAFEKEIYIYSHVRQTFYHFQQEKGVKDLIDFIPHCYDTQMTNTEELLIFENVKYQNYSLWNRNTPMTHDHIKLILEAYGKWHALSLALKVERPECFQKLTEDNVNMYSYFIEKVKMFDVFVESFTKARDGAIFPSDEEILKKLQFSKDQIKYILTDLFYENPVYQVILHGDGWNNNFMFMAENVTKKPSKVFVIDWQCSGLGSPVIDLSYLIYSCCDTGMYKDVEELLKIYYNSLSKSLNLLGCDSHRIFAYGKLMQHWKKFSCFGLVVSTFILKLSLCSTEEAPDLAEAAEQGKEFLENYNFDVKDQETYFKRVRDNFVHYIENLN
ncbi:uncharacterized protein BDFB_007581 [Asbolus verrucosus]|uniref:CHK kinase-like domain-containing protein n=1 Tax=Asbolus verrucosus TaxID=1661398 RepID=A0A482W809_ASBVE|nr:uncharacterized protein BDFB_007581 [Asbolus verrucosus]